MRWLTLFFYLDNSLSLSLSLSLSPPIFNNSIAIIFFFNTNQLEQFFFSFLSGNKTLPQINCYNFFSLQFSATPLPKSLLNFCHNSFFFLFSFFPPISGNLVATILIFSLLTPLQFQQLGCHNWFPFWALHLALRALHLAGRVLGSKNFSNEITEI